MTQAPLHIAATEHGHIHLFDLALADTAAKSFLQPPFGSNGQGWLLQSALGATALDPVLVEAFPVADLDEIGLAGYLTEGLGVAEAQVEADAKRLAQITDYVVILRSKAFKGTAQDLTVKAPLTYIASYTEEAAPLTLEKLTSDSAKGIISGPEAAPAPASTKGLWVFPVIALALLALLWVVKT